MTDTSNTTQAPKAKVARKRTPKDAPVTLSSVVQTISAKRDMDATKCGKLVRSYIRGHDADLRKAFKWPPEDKQRADGNRYPPMPRKAADALYAHFVK